MQGENPVTRDVLLMLFVAVAWFLAGIVVGQGICRTHEVRAEAAAPVKVIGRAAAWNRVYGRPRPPLEDLRIPKLKADR